jgi:quercetin dioxygenase-like cupin family protein
MRRVRNLLTGETMTFTRVDDETLEFDLALRPIGVPGGVAHRHRPTERIEVRSGALLAFVAGSMPRRVQSGDTVEIPSGRWHMLVALAPSSARVSVRPPMRFEELLTCAAAVGSGDVRPSTLRRLDALLREHDCAPRLPGPR